LSVHDIFKNSQKIVWQKKLHRPFLERLFSPIFWPPSAYLSAVEAKRHSHQQPEPVEGYFLNAWLLWRALTFSKDVLKSSCRRFSTSPLRRYFDTPNINPFAGTQDSSVCFEKRLIARLVPSLPTNMRNHQTFHTAFEQRAEFFQTLRSGKKPHFSVYCG